MPGQLWATNSLGGYLSSAKLSKILRKSVQPMVKFRQFADVKDASQQGTGKGQTFTYNVYSKVATAGTTLVETATMPKTNFTLTQGTLTITEAGNSVDYTGKLDNLSETPVKKIINDVLSDDASQTFDRLTHAQFNLTPLRVVPTAGTSITALTLTTNGTATLTNNIAFSKDHAKLMVDLMKERNIPMYDGNNYMALARVSALRKLKNDLESIRQYTSEGLSMVMNGEVGKYENIRYVEQTNIPTGGAADSTTFNPYTETGDAWNNGLSDWIFFFGKDTVAEGIAVPEEMRGKIPGDYGRDQGVAWYYLGGFGIVHTSAAQARIVKWDSAA